jgi:hypothetical protein
MLVKDSEVQERHRQTGVIEATHNTAYTAANEKIRHKGFVGDVTNERIQRGNWLDATVFMARVRKLNPNLVLVAHPQQSGYANIYANVDGHRVYTGIACEDGQMPEWTVMGVREERVPIDDKPGTYWAPVQTLGRVEQRGWRDVLLRLIQGRHLDISAVEREFGAGDRHSWAVLSGKKKDRPLV